MPSAAPSTVQAPPPASTAETPLDGLRARLGRTHLRQRLGLERDHEVFVLNRPGAHFFYPENWYSVHGAIRHCLRLSGLYGRARRNAHRHRLVEHPLALRRLPPVFHGMRILHLTDLHVDMAAENTRAIAAAVRRLDYDLCVLTGDYRARTFGPIAAVIEGMSEIRDALHGPVYAVLGNHDSLRLVPELECLGIRFLLNETVTLERDGARLHLAGVDDAHYYQLHNLDKVAGAIPEDETAILLSHTPEIYRQAAHAGFAAMLSGHTHGGQICLPGGIPLIWDAHCPRRLAAGPWRYGALVGYTSTGAGTSVVNARLNCPPEITIHTLQPD
ncbi:metallophosphoesterase [Marichromatium purpuratum 984]|uniref:Metallophosphoesterase n=1 Tax=Marichromatium purpuratum 984 TaxID=765910 RepID=W0E3D3_MARPU|nr:metallophosphoesterase [Marichromatium purpuratum]AHF03709.1 metallophosphoesterase [Marichromatium purpuratum 984]